jgi:hypothetical protein
MVHKIASPLLPVMARPWRWQSKNKIIRQSELASAVRDAKRTDPLIQSVSAVSQHPSFHQ